MGLIRRFQTKNRPPWREVSYRSGSKRRQVTEMTIPGFDMSRGPHNKSGEVTRHRRIKIAASGAIGLSTTGFIALAQVPWWIGAMLSPAVLLYALVGRVFPQKSSDRIAWWRDRRHAKRADVYSAGRGVRLSLGWRSESRTSPPGSSRIGADASGCDR